MNDECPKCDHVGCLTDEFRDDERWGESPKDGLSNYDVYVCLNPRCEMAYYKGAKTYDYVLLEETVWKSW